MFGGDLFDDADRPAVDSSGLTHQRPQCGRDVEEHAQQPEDPLLHAAALRTNICNEHSSSRHHPDLTRAANLVQHELHEDENVHHRVGDEQSARSPVRVKATETRLREVVNESALNRCFTTI